MASSHQKEKYLEDAKPGPAIFLAVNCAFGTISVSVNELPVWRQSVQAVPLYARVPLNDWLTRTRNEISVSLSELPDAAHREGACHLYLSNMHQGKLTVTDVAPWSDSPAPSDAALGVPWRFTLDLPAGALPAPAFPKCGLGRAEVERRALDAVLNLRQTIAARNTAGVLKALAFGIQRKAQVLQVPESFLTAAWNQILSKLFAGENFQVAPLAAADLEVLHGQGGVALIQRWGYARQPVILAHSSEATLLGDLYWMENGGLSLNLELIPGPIQWNR